MNLNLPPANWRINMAIWALIFAATVAWQLISVRSRRLVSFGDLIRLARRWWILRWALLVFWMWLGWHLFVRTAIGD
ncbi:hypothetical protein AB0873_11235 [Micromonospora sp. NPDC047707]|uniref:hypothetical protein n=1 Tax=Micromonospora sp. NPDC047707 TaxID=3154498 RepID=UPI003453A809